MEGMEAMEMMEEGRRKIAWARAHMPLLAHLQAEYERLRPLAGLRLTMSIHLEAKTARLALLLRDAGASVCVTGSNPLSTQDDVAQALAGEGLCVFARHGVTPGEYEAHLRQSLAHEPHIVIDDGGDLVHLLHGDCAALGAHVLGGCEETTTGVLRLKARAREGALRFPMVNINDADMKHLFDNRYGTGQSVWDAILRTTNLCVAGSCVVVCGYGWCGKGVAMRARGLGARVLVCEVDPVKAVEAVMDGHEVRPMGEAAALGDLFITVTGCRDVVRPEHFLLMKEGAILCNAGHFDVEVDAAGLAAMAVSRAPARKNIEAFRLGNGRTVYLLAEGRLVNLAAGDGHPVEIMDLSFALQAMCAVHVAAAGRSGSPLAPGVHPVPPAVDAAVAQMKLSALGRSIDALTPAQEAYLQGYEA